MRHYTHIGAANTDQLRALRLAHAEGEPLSYKQIEYWSTRYYFLDISFWTGETVEMYLEEPMAVEELAREAMHECRPHMQVSVPIGTMNALLENARISLN